MSAAAVIFQRRKQFIRRFRDQGANAPDRAIPYSQIWMHTRVCDECGHVEFFKGMPELVEA